MGNVVLTFFAFSIFSVRLNGNVTIVCGAMQFTILFYFFYFKIDVTLKIIIKLKFDSGLL
jgi:hypothetical protein